MQERWLTLHKSHAIADIQTNVSFLMKPLSRITDCCYIIIETMKHSHETNRPSLRVYWIVGNRDQQTIFEFRSQIEAKFNKHKSLV